MESAYSNIADATTLPTSPSASVSPSASASPSAPPTLGVTPYSESGGLTQSGLDWSWTWGSGMGVGVWEITGIPTGELGRMSMSLSLDSHGAAPTGPNWSYGAFIVEAEGGVGSVSPNVMGSYTVSASVDTLGVRNVVNNIAHYSLSSTMYFVLKAYRTAPVLAGSYITGHLISFTLRNSSGVIIAEYP